MILVGKVARLRRHYSSDDGEMLNKADEKMKNAHVRFSPLAILVGVACVTSGVSAKTYTFDPALISGADKNVDVSLFTEGAQLPGTYTVDIMLEGERVGSQDVIFSLQKDEGGKPFLYPCLSVEDLSRYGVKTEDYPALGKGDECVKISAIPQASFDFQFYAQQLHLLIPQASLRPKSYGIAPQQLWDDGIPALLLGYNANTSRLENRSGSGQGSNGNNINSSYVQLTPGANLGAWRLRNQTSWQRQGESSGKWQTAYTYAERGLYDMKSRVTFGDRSTPGDIFDSVPFRGVMLASDDNMVPFNQRDFAPVVRGIARTQARIEVKQNGYVIYNETVAPGPFALTDLNTAGDTGGDLQVTVWETDGNPQVFTVAYQTPAIALKEGHLRYNVMAGQYRPSTSIDKKMVGQATIMYGLPWNLTAYAGGQGSEHYQSATLGLGVSMGELGALSVDGTGSHGQRKGQDTENGSAWRVRYSKNVMSTDTTITMTGYRYATAGYNSLADVMDSYHGDSLPDNWWYYDERDRRKSTTTAMLTQTIGRWGSLSMNGTRTDYWNRPGHDNSFGVSYGVGLYKGITMSLNWSENKQINSSGESRTNRITSLWLSVPLDRWLGGNTYASYQMTSPSEGSQTQEVGINGTAFDQQMNWDVRQRHESGSSGSDSDNSYMRLNWNGAYGQVGGNYSYSSHQRQMGADVSGGMVIHSQGVTFGQSLGDTIALVEAPGASGVKVLSGRGIKTDFRGYTTSASLNPYQENTLSLDPLNLPEGVDINQTDVRLIPTQGAVIAAKFATRTGGRALMTLNKPDGEVVPFGTLVKVTGKEGSAGIVGGKGQVYLTGLPDKGELLAKWANGQCIVNYTLPEKSGPTGVFMMKGACQ